MFFIKISKIIIQLANFSKNSNNKNGLKYSMVQDYFKLFLMLSLDAEIEKVRANLINSIDQKNCYAKSRILQGIVQDN